MNWLGGKRFFLFDLDGTLVDSSGLHERVFRETLRDAAPDLLGGFDYESLKGRSTAEALLDLGVPGGAGLEILVGEKQRRYRDAVRTGELRLMAGAIEALEFLKSRRHRMFVVTGGSRLSVEAALESTGIRTYFEGLVTSDDVSRGKPSPDGFLLCMKRFGLSEGPAVGIEDSDSGYAACRAAGLDAVLVNHPVVVDHAGAREAKTAAFATLLEVRDALVGAEAWALA